MAVITFGTALSEIQGTNQIAAPQLAPGDPGGGGTGGGGIGINTGIPVSTGGTTTTTTSTTPSTMQNILNNILSYFTGTGCGIGDFFLRIAFFILGFIAVIGAIYLYKSNNPLLALPGRIARGTVKAGTSALRAAAQGEE